MKATQSSDKNKCGIIMPISSIDGCDESHWTEVRQLIEEAVQKAGFTASLVSEARETGVIHKRIVENLNQLPMVVCDVSCKNPNVMFELGMRLAFDMATIIIKDDLTAYSFDTNGIEHLVYRRDMRRTQTNEFIDILADKVKATFEASQDPNYTTFLKHYGTFKVADLDKTDVGAEELILDEVKALRAELGSQGGKLDRLLAVRHPRQIDSVTTGGRRGFGGGGFGGDGFGSGAGFGGGGGFSGGVFGAGLGSGLPTDYPRMASEVSNLAHPSHLTLEYCLKGRDKDSITQIQSNLQCMPGASLQNYVPGKCGHIHLKIDIVHDDSTSPEFVRKFVAMLVGAKDGDCRGAKESKGD